MRVRISGLVFLAITLTTQEGPAQTQSGREFEVASVKRAPPGEKLYQRLEIDSVRFFVRAAPLRYLINVAYGFDSYQLVGAPKWMDDDLYSITASILPPADHAQVMEMLRNLLTERFHLKVHEDTHQTKVYELVVAKGGEKLVPLPDGETPRPPPNPSLEQVTLNAGPSMPDLVRFLNQRVGAGSLGWPVVDHTGLHDRYKIFLTFSVKADPDGRSGTFDMDYLSELPRQIGLRLEPTRADYSFLVIDSAERLAP